jgi:hypothetical protein
MTTAKLKGTELSKYSPVKQILKVTKRPMICLVFQGVSFVSALIMFLEAETFKKAMPIMPAPTITKNGLKPNQNEMAAKRAMRMFL